jgi:hypothetical protein
MPCILMKILTLKFNVLFFYIFVDVTSVAINCKFYVYHRFVETINVKLTTASLVTNFVLP